MRTIELLAPAKNLECGLAAIEHGADAVYIGAQRFGARVAAGNSVDDIAILCHYAHRFGVKVYVTINTILYDDELGATRQLLDDLWQVGVDALLIQDMGVLNLLSINEKQSFALHASTQTDNRTTEKVSWLRSIGFKRVVLARELSIREIAKIHAEVPDVEVEVFVHGALCVSYSGVCYASQYCFGRSANRGECAQFCRLKFDLKDASGRLVEHQRHLLSLKDICRIEYLEQLIDAGVVSFKIEGRLKDSTYVKNVVAAYSEELNKIIAKHPAKYQRASRGRVTYTFKPNLRKTFNRGFTSYFLEGRQPNIASFDTPKARGEYVGYVKEIRNNSFNVAGTTIFANGDGLCFLNSNQELEGFRVNRVEGNRLFPQRMPVGLLPGMKLYRNNDQEFEHVLSHSPAKRKIPVKMEFSVTDQGFQLNMDGISIELDLEKQLAQKPQRENIVRQLTKLGGTPYICEHIEILKNADLYFIPSSQLAELRRRAVETCQKRALERASSFVSSHTKNASAKFLADAPLRSTPAQFDLVWQPEYKKYTYLYNISNRLSRSFYEHQGLKDAAEAFELSPRPSLALIMQCRHCIRYSLGFCLKHGGKKSSWREPLYLELSDGRQFPLEFNCKECQMNVYAK
ncbi:MAG: U32 family peptidase [Prevotella sp.]|nr:U32 family peptidase [Prevotella sp.]